MYAFGGIMDMMRDHSNDYHYFPNCSAIKPMFYNKFNSACGTCSPLCPPPLHPEGSWMYYNQTGSIPALEEASTHITNYYNECLASKVEAQIGKQAVSFVKSKALNVAKTVAEDL